MREMAKSYLPVTLFCWIAGAVISYLRTKPDQQIHAVLWQTGIVLLSAGSLASSAGLFQEIMKKVIEGDAASPIRTMRIWYWAGAKVIVLGSLLGVITKMKDQIPPVSLFTGLSTVIIVPIAGSWIWMQRNHPNA